MESSHDKKAKYSMHDTNSIRLYTSAMQSSHSQNESYANVAVSSTRIMYSTIQEMFV